MSSARLLQKLRGLIFCERGEEEVILAHTLYRSLKRKSPIYGSSDGLSSPLLRRFWFRSIVGVVAPLTIAGYYLVMWQIYLVPLDPSAPFIVGPPGASYVYYSWFIVGIVGLNLSLYSMAGVEASMLMDPTWDVGNAMVLLMHADGTWSGPGGWVKTAKRLVRQRLSGGSFTPPTRLWFILAIPSILIFAAWPLSGLAFETTAGFIRQRNGVGQVPNTIGFSYATFNNRNGGDVFNDAQIIWTNALDARVPGKGIIYTQPGAERIPAASLPKDDGVSKIFLTAQAENPIEGPSWGLALQYNCSIVKTLSELTLLKYQKSANITAGVARLQGRNQDILVTATNETYSNNLYAAIEFGYKNWPNASAQTRLQKDDPDSIFTKTTHCYFNQADNVTGDYPGLDDGDEDEGVFEMVLWQLLQPAGYVNPLPQYNFSIDHNLTELYGVYNYNQFLDSNFSLPLTAVGARCTSSSNVGTAFVDGVHSTYTNFVRTDTPINTQINRCSNRLGASSINSMVSSQTINSQTISGQNTVSLMSALVKSALAPPPFYAAFDTDPIDAGTGTLLQLSYLQANDLKISLLRANAAYAVRLMYTGGEAFTDLDGSHTSSANANVTEFLPGAVLKPGIISPYVPATLFLAWALAVSVLCVVYGFRRRWSATLDGYALFRFGVDLSDSAKESIAAFPNTREMEECHVLSVLPGFVGDQWPDSRLGHITLVDGVEASKSKCYQ